MLEVFKDIAINKDSKEPLYSQLYNEIKSMVTRGTVLPESRLPSVRQMAALHGINQITVVSAFKQLENEGYIYTKKGSGTFVSSQFVPATQTSSAINSTLLDELYSQEDITLINNGQIKITENTINFASATPSVELFPVEDFKLVLNKVLERDMGNAFNYQESQGFGPLRESVCETLRKAIPSCTPENVQIISGAQQGIDLVSKALLKPGDYVIAESPTYTGAIAVFKSRGAEITELETGEGGPELAVLEYKLRKYKPKLIYTIPSFQNPTGYSYSNEKRQSLIALAEKYDCIIIEDDYVSDLDFGKRNYMPLKSLDTTGRVVFVKSFSKMFMPGLRIGFMLVPQKIHSDVLEAKHTTDISTSGLIQRAFDLYIRNGFWDKHFETMHKIYFERYSEIVRVLDLYLPEYVKYKKPGGGLNIWLELPYGFPVNSLFNRCSSDQVVFAPGKIFFNGNAAQKMNHIRLSFAAVQKDQIQKGIDCICRNIELLSNKADHHNQMPIL